VSSWFFFVADVKKIIMLTLFFLLIEWKMVGRRRKAESPKKKVGVRKYVVDHPVMVIRP
jgi:hypothetical protein